MAFAAGTRLGPYAVTALVGVGGMGEVYKATDTRLARTVAIKTLSSQIASDPELRQRFEREAKAISSLNHPRICTLHDIGCHDGVDFLVMEYLEGETLAQRLTQGPLPLEAALRYAIEMADALEAAHERGIVHRDFKPGNVTLTAGGVKLLDFGIAKLVTRPGLGGEGSQALTAARAGATGAAVIGTVNYMSPEQARGMPVDRRTDIWAFGCVLFEMLTGKKAFVGPTAADTTTAILEREPNLEELPTSTPAAVRHVLRRCLEKDAKRRLHDIGDARTELEDALSAVGRGTDEGSAQTHWPSAAPTRLRVPATIVAAAALVVGIVAYWLLFAPAGPSLFTAEQSARAREPSPASAISVVVLPFANLSGDPSQEFFSDGMTEEVTAALARVPRLRVVARTAAFQFKGPGQDVRMVAQVLGASHLVEGSVRRSGTRVRVNAQLIEASSGTDLWTQSYNRTADDALVIQDDIANAIAEALQIPLGLESGPQIIPTHISDLDTYQNFLRARAMVHLRGYGSLSEAAALLEQVVAGDSNYAPAWAYLAQAYLFALNFHPAWLSGDFEMLKPVAAALMPKAEAASRRAIELDRSLADGYAVLGLTLELRGGLAQAEDLYRQAMALDPTNPDVLHFYSRLLAEVGRLNEAHAMRQQLQALDPFVPTYEQVTSWLLWLNGETDAAIALAESLPPFNRGYAAPRLLASVGRYDEAANLITTNAPGMFLPGVVEAAATLLRSAPAEVASPEALPRLGWFNFIFVHVGAPDRTLEFYEGGVEVGYSVSISNALLWHPYYASLRKTERYKDFMRKRGVVDYWRERGWPELCRPVDANDFTCD